MTPQQWQEHVDAFSHCNQTKRTYAKEHNLSYHQFLYWYHKLSADKSSANGHDFISVEMKRSTQSHGAALGSLEFPNGSKLLIHDVGLLQPLLSICLGRSF